MKQRKRVKRKYVRVRYWLPVPFFLLTRQMSFDELLAMYPR